MKVALENKLKVIRKGKKIVDFDYATPTEFGKDPDKYLKKR